MSADEVVHKAKRARSYGRGMKRGVLLAAVGFVAYKLGRRDGRWAWEKPTVDR